ncbi:tyrosine-type recombinase/integrase [Pseudoxanthobacter sp. M-2]|uniref:tyrosine-type recombinase/integrase n=1 Tax=Pseudoxanthobacter sp. M-2 TaxID=3078754 RepID=UPI0038FCB3D6
MTRRKSLSDNGVAALKPKATRYTLPDPEVRGHYVRVMPSGLKTFVAVAREPGGKQVWATLGSADHIGIAAAREAAREAIRRIKDGLPAVAVTPRIETFGDVAATYLKRHVEAKGLRSEREIRRCLAVYVLPRWADREFAAVRRGDVAALLDAVEDNHGARQADYVLAIVRGIANWYAARNDGYVSPIVRGMRRTAPSSRKRDRILSDDEIRALWATAGSSGTFGAILRFALVTAQRREKVMSLRWEDIADGVWTVPSEDREKGTGGALRLPPLALGVVEAQPRIGQNPYVFAGRGPGHFNGVSKAKAAFDKAAGINDWSIHDLRRSARSLMARAGVRPDIAERVLGHVLQGVEGVYDRHHYQSEKADALARLSTLLESILDPKDNVVPMARASV